MARLRPWKCYRKPKRPYTRVSRSKKKNYIPGAPPTRLRFLVMGNASRGNWKYVAYLVSRDEIQVRDNALEAMRVMINKYLETKMGRENYLFEIRAYPHQVYRENPLAYGAGADRISKGMRLAFGKPKGRAAVLYDGKKVIAIHFDDIDRWDLIKYALEVAKSKLPGRYSIELYDLEQGRRLFM